MKNNELICDCNVIHQEIVDKILKNKPKEDNLIYLAELFKILGNLTRVKIIFALSIDKMCVCDLANVLNMTKSSISHQLAILRKMGIVKYEKLGKEVHYLLDDNHIKNIYEISLKHIEHKLKKGIK